MRPPQPQQPPQPPAPGTARRQIKQRAQYGGEDAMSFWVGRIQRNIKDRPWRAFSVAASVAVGVALAIAIIAAANGIQSKITTQVPDLGPRLDPILHDAKRLLSELAIGFTAALVGLVTWINMTQRRREIGINVQHGEHRESIIFEFMAESFVLCVVGGVAGVVSGLILCQLVQTENLPMQPSGPSIIALFPTTVLLTFGVTAVLAAMFARKATVDTNL
jgi:ABC-type lipoprotein release transport system permease subunit